MLVSWLVTASLAGSAGPGADAPFQLSAVEHTDRSLLRPVVRAEPLQPLVDDAADEFGVPAVLLSALVWEASHYDVAVTRQWAGYGPMDLRDDRDPDVEDAAILLGLSADALVTDAAANIRGGAALLADGARRANDGVLPDPDLLEDWWDATRVFSGSHDPVVQRNFALYVYEQIWAGVDATVVRTGEHVQFGGIPVDIPGLMADAGVPGFPALPDYPGAVGFVAACNSNYSDYSRSGGDITYVVIHTMQGSYSGTISWFQNCSAQVSAHYDVRSSDGEITQQVAEADVAWHAGNWSYNEMSIGIEHEGFVEDPGTWYTDAMYEGSAALVGDILARTSVVGDRNHIIGHVEVPGATHTDPGTGWDWAYYMSLVDGSWVIAGDLTGVVAVEDVFTGVRIAGASVTLVQTGEAVVVGDDGTFFFPDLPEGDYTVTASAPGYTDASCDRTIDASGTFWCSIPLFPAPEDPGTGEEPPTGGEGPLPGDDAPVTDAPPPTSWTRVPMEPHGCGCGSTSGAGFSILGLGALVLLGRRRNGSSA